MLPPFVPCRIQQRNGRKTLTTVQGLSSDYDLKKIVRACKKEFACNGTVVEHPEYGEVCAACPSSLFFFYLFIYLFFFLHQLERLKGITKRGEKKRPASRRSENKRQLESSVKNRKGKSKLAITGRGLEKVFTFV